jgi:hypothetical protein
MLPQAHSSRRPQISKTKKAVMRKRRRLRNPPRRKPSTKNRLLLAKLLKALHLMLLKPVRLDKI